MRFLRVIIACVFDPLLPGVCFHASCHTLFFIPYCSSFFFVFNSSIFRIILLFLLLFAS